MTPLANHYIKEMSLLLKDRESIQNPDHVNVGELINGCRCFEITDVLPLIRELAEATKALKSEEIAKAAIETYSFLPANQRESQVRLMPRRKPIGLIF